MGGGDQWATYHGDQWATWILYISYPDGPLVPMAHWSPIQTKYFMCGCRHLKQYVDIVGVWLFRNIQSVHMKCVKTKPLYFEEY